jgi:hypothetical protein
MVKIHKLALPFMLLAIICMRQGFAATEPVSDVRVLIDVSGSMKVNDPDNLRVPAMKMLVGLMPEESKAGIWTFAKMVNMMVPWKTVDEAWRQQALKQVGNIHSYGLFTNIEQVLLKATANQKKPSNRFQRSLILLSDGYVDIQPNQQASAASRERILKNVIPKLKAAGIKVHTIALSDKADKSLLQAISIATDGVHEQANSAEDLQRIFLHLFEQSAPVDTVPLADNQFNIDSSVTQMTVLAFRTSDSSQTQLRMPSGELLSQQDANEQVRWLNEASFDLITIDQPAIGQWQINAKLDPDNRVMVVTDLQLKVSDLPNNILQGETFDFEARLTDHNKVIEREAFLTLVEGQLQRQSGNERTDVPLMRDKGEVVYRATLGQDFSAGRNDLIVTIKSATFERQRRQSVKVLAAPVHVEASQLPDAARSHRIEVQAEPRLIKPDTIKMTALLQAENGNEWPYDVPQTDTNKWQLTITDLEPMQDYTVSLQVRGENLEGRQVFIQPEPLKLIDVSDLFIDDAMTDSEAMDDADQAQLNLFAEVGDQKSGQAEEDPVDLMDIEMDAELVEEDLTNNESGLSDNMKLLIGNGVILLLLILGIIWWRKQTASAVLAGDLM